MRKFVLLSVLLILFQTAARAQNFKFVVYGDTRSGHKTHRKIVALIRAQKPTFVIHTGDLVGWGGDSKEWKNFDEITAEMRQEAAFYPARGNHDLGGPGYANRAPAKVESGNRLYYAFTQDKCRFLALDCYSPYKPGSPQYVWLVNELKTAQNRYDHVFVQFHEPPYSIGAHGSNLTIRSTFSPLFKKYGVRFVLNGHDHNYYRTIRDNVAYIVTGGGGAPLYDCDPKKGAIAGDVWEKVNNFVVLEVVGKQVKVTAYRADGTVLDTFTR